VLSTLLLSHHNSARGALIPNTGTTIRAEAVFGQWDWRAQYPVGPGPMTEDDGF